MTNLMPFCNPAWPVQSCYGVLLAESWNESLSPDPSLSAEGSKGYFSHSTGYYNNKQKGLWKSRASFVYLNFHLVEEELRGSGFHVYPVKTQIIIEIFDSIFSYFLGVCLCK
ncbi:hypothetical protein NE237_026280 [Protea cynaroides]|uniref:Uncharacterized protein n=1 Tax=Protea cynaroides TaxID=273540 RepID=A0A9Q0H8M0_9MAGN|nr:hypothetical protein NE237_026280 [Protea cynaroides]